MRLSASPRIKAYRAAIGLGHTSEIGQNRPVETRVRVVRSTHERCAGDIELLRLGAKKRLATAPRYARPRR
jgi:hypothetical protein